MAAVVDIAAPARAQPSRTGRIIAAATRCAVIAFCIVLTVSLPAGLRLQPSTVDEDGTATDTSGSSGPFEHGIVRLAVPEAFPRHRAVTEVVARTGGRPTAAVSYLATQSPAVDRGVLVPTEAPQPPAVGYSDGRIPLEVINPLHPAAKVPSATFVDAKGKTIVVTTHAPVSPLCPTPRIPGTASADGKSTHEAIHKYTRYTSQYCNTSGMLQMNIPLDIFQSFMDRIAVIARIPRNGRIFDLGSGCGTMLNYYHLRYNTTGVGVDVTRDAVDHAHAHRQPGQTFCWTDAAARGAMAHFADNSFDAVVSWAVLYHVRRTLVQCEIVQHLVRILRPGGVAYIGHLRTEKTQKYWTKGRCQIEGASWHRTKDSRTFRMSSFKRHGFFSVVVTKHANVNATTNASSTVAGEDTDS